MIYREMAEPVIEDYLKLLECSKVGQLIQNACLFLMETQPKNPIEYLALNYEWEPEKTSHVRQAFLLLKQLHYSHRNFQDKTHKAYLILGQCPAHMKLKGLTGDVQMDLLQLLIRKDNTDLPEREINRLMERLYCRATEVVPFSTFRASVTTCLIFDEYIKESTELYKLLADLDGTEGGQAKRSVCDAILTRLWNACLPGSKTGSKDQSKGTKDVDAVALLGDVDALNQILDNFQQNDRTTSRERFLSQATDVFIMRLSESTQ